MSFKQILHDAEEQNNHENDAIARKTEKQKQEDYEAEVVVYRALEKLKEPLIVFHSFEYTHKQFHIWDPNHDRKACGISVVKPNCKNADADEGENDFVVFGPDYIVIIEVKNPSLAQTTSDDKTKDSKTNDSYVENSEVALNDSRNKIKHSSQPRSSTKPAEKIHPILGAIEKATAQLERGMKIVERISDFTKLENGKCSKMHVFRLVTFPNICKSQTGIAEENVPDNLHVIYKDDLQEFQSFWVNIKNEGINVNGKKTFSGDITKIQSAVLRLFASHKGQANKKTLSLKECVVEIDLKLRNSEITFRRKNTPPNPSVIKTSSELKNAPFVMQNINIFETCLKLNYITDEQKNAFEDENYPILISGATGSGKTIVLLAKAIHIILKERGTKVFILFQSNFKLATYSDIIKRAGIRVYEYEAGLNKVDDSILPEHDIIICHGYPANFDELDLKAKAVSPELKLLFFADDCQDDDWFWTTEDGGKWSCLVADFTQESQLFRRDLQQRLARLKETRNFKIHWLRRSYRNTHNIVSQLIQLGEKNAKHKRLAETERDGLLPQLSLIPKHGHFIHGPQVTVKIYRLPEEVTHSDYHCFVDKLINKEYNQYSEICLDSQISCAFLLKNSAVFSLEQSLTF